MSGLFMNPTKYEIKLSPTCPHNNKVQCANILNCNIVERLGKYLGGFIDGPSRDRENYKVILDHLTKQLQGWKANMLSQAARCTLIQSVLASIPIYYLQFTRLTRNEAARCDGMLSRFFLGHMQDKKATPMIAWNRICHPKQLGGLGIRRFDPLNRALLGKQYWRILTNQSALIIRLPFKIIMFFWKLLQRGLPLGCDLLHRGFRIEGKCTFGCHVTEDEEHLFKDCPFTRALWFGLDISFIGRCWLNDSFCCSVTSWCNNGITHPTTGASILPDVILVCWALYTKRNKVLFCHELPDPAIVVCIIQKLRTEFTRIQTLHLIDPFFNVQRSRSPRSPGGVYPLQATKFPCSFPGLQYLPHSGHLSGDSTSHQTKLGMPDA
ncbi:reverse transcriptase [Senna tora]|uniref:Reverse transcriptase n=1 Tax=Senna tora TaxID=362788 RepID=A0A834TV21_9FABA|nr:reverse transcriptase [Senna tora]